MSCPKKDRRGRGFWFRLLFVAFTALCCGGCFTDFHLQNKNGDSETQIDIGQNASSGGLDSNANGYVGADTYAGYDIYADDDTYANNDTYADNDTYTDDDSDLGVDTENRTSKTLVGQLGLLDTSGMNPLTGSVWGAGDSYRLVFVSSTSRDANSNDIADYNTHVQSAAKAAGLGVVNWTVIGSTAAVSARENTDTTATSIDGSFFLVDGTTVVAKSISDLWDGNLEHSINMNEYGTGGMEGDIATGSRPDGNPSNRVLGGSDDDPPIVTVGRAHSRTSQWMQVYHMDAVSSSPLYAMSEVLWVQSL